MRKGRCSQNMLAVLGICFAVLSAIVAPAQAFADGAVRVHVLPFSYTDAIVVECDGHFGMIDAGEDSDFPSGSDDRYPLREGITQGGGIENEMADYLEDIGVTPENFDFFIGTHPHSDHIAGADEVIYRFKPKAIYTPYYDDSLITNEAFLWDNLYVYDHLVSAARWAAGPMGYGATFVQYFGDDTDPANVDPSLVGDPVFFLGSARVEIMNHSTLYISTKVPDANYFSYGVLVEAANGRRAFFAGDINNYTDGESSVSDEMVLAQQLRDVDLFKMGHHGGSSSNSSAYLRAILRKADGEDRPVAIQTGEYRTLPLRTIDALNELGVRHFTASSARHLGCSAFVATLDDDRVRTNLDDARSIVQRRNSAPYATLYKAGLPITASGWQAALDGTWYYFSNDGALTHGWLQQGGNWYYLSEKGVASTGWRKISGKWYYFSPANCAMQTGWVNDGVGIYYLQNDGSMYIGKGWARVRGSWCYYADTSGAVFTGWLKDAGKWYYLRSTDGLMAKGWQKVAGTWYYLNDSGVMQTGWIKDGKNWYYLRGSGAMAEGWARVSGAWYYLRPGSGAMATGWAKADGAWYYLDGSGAMRTGWLKDKGKWYYLTGSGAMATGERVIGGVSYSFDDSGALR